MVAMPKAPMHKNHPLVSRQNDVWPARQTFCVQAEPISHLVEQAAYNQFRTCVLALDPAHIPTPLLLGQSVFHFSVLASCRA
jgi:hypothetical protein